MTTAALTETPWGSNVIVEVSSAAPDADPVWVDISQRVIVPQGSTLETWLGRVTELDSPEPGHGQMVLNNRDDALTPGNPSSPYFPWWKQARRCRVREVIGYVAFELADFFLEVPENVIITQDPADTDSDVTLVVSGVDALGRFQAGRKFRAALSEWIVFKGGTDLVGFWPLTDPSEPYLGVGPITTAATITTSLTGTFAPVSRAVPQQGTAPPAAEASGLRCITVAGTSGHSFNTVILPSSISAAVPSGSAVTVVWWVNLPSFATTSFQQLVSFAISDAHTGMSVDVERDPTTGALTLNVLFDMTATLTLSGGPGANALLPMGVRINPSAATAELWLGSLRNTVALSGAAVGSVTLTGPIGFGAGIDFDISNAQVYVGSTWGYADYLAQINFAYNPFERQLTGTRINTVLDMAGFSSARRDIDAGTVQMSKVAMAGKTVADLISEASDTERGRLFMQAGRMQFHDRSRVLNI